MQQHKIATIPAFVARVNALANLHDAFDLFEDECTEELRSQIFELCGPANTQNEPFRLGMHILGFTEF